MSSRSQSARLRKTFRYPDDDADSDSLPEALDEEGSSSPNTSSHLIPPSTTKRKPTKLTPTPPEQANLIHTLRTQSSATNTLYTRIFTAFPLLLTLAYLPPLSAPRGGGAALPLLAVSSLLCTAWAMYFLPPARTGIALLDTLVAGTKPASAKARGKRKVGAGGDGPVQRYLGVMNVCLAGVVLVAGLLRGGEDVGGLGVVRLSALPAVALGVVLGVKAVMASVDVGELEELRYGYKGA